MKSRILMLSFLMVAFVSCRVTLVPAYDASIADQITKAAKMNDALYLGMLEVKEADRKYETYAQQYLDIELEINSILLKNQARDHNQDLVAITQNLQKLFVQFKDDHKAKGTLSNADVKLNEVQISAAWVPLLVAENALKSAK